MTQRGLDGVTPPSHGEFMANVIIHLPHASRYIPLSERAGLAIDDEELERQHLALVDDRTAELFAPDGNYAYVVEAPVSRLVVDVERFREDALEPASQLGMGAVYTRGVKNVVLRPSLTAAERERLLKTWYDPHHQRLDEIVGPMRGRIAAGVLIDAHSYPVDALPTENPLASRPEICIGTDPEWTRGVDRIVKNHFVESGYTVGINQPFSGTLVPNVVRKDPQRHTQWSFGPFALMAPCRGFYSVMIEVRRDVYLCPGTHLPGPRFNHLHYTLNTLYARLRKFNFWMNT